jgi:hypothetical protein
MSGVNGGADLHVDVAVKDQVNVNLDVNVYVADRRPRHDGRKSRQDQGSRYVPQLGVEPGAKSLDLAWVRSILIGVRAGRGIERGEP